MVKKNQGERIKVAVSGAYGRMGRSVVAAVSAEKDMRVVGAVDPAGKGGDAGEAAGIGNIGVEICGSLKQVIDTAHPDVIVDFTTAEDFGKRAAVALKAGLRVVAGTTGIDSRTIKKLEKLAREKKTGILIAPNFAIGAVLMMQFAEKAAAYMPKAEIIEFHHDRKLDAPSGTAMATAEKIKAARQGKAPADPTKIEKLEGARGGRIGGINVHSVRLEGFLAHQEVIFGGKGQTLTIRHDTISRESFMPGVVLAVRKIIDIKELVFGLENLL